MKIRRFSNFINEEKKYKYYSLYDKQTDRYLSIGLNSTSKEEAIEDGIEYILSEPGEDDDEIKKMNLEDKESFLNSSEIEVEGHDMPHEDELSESKISPVRYNEFNKKDEISSYEHALILHLNTKHNIPDVIQWLNSEAKQFGCKAEFADDMVIITSSKGLAGDLTKFKNGFLGFENLDK